MVAFAACTVRGIGAKPLGALAAVCLAALALSATAVPARGEGWVSEPTISASESPESTLTGVSCVSAAFCMALGESDPGREPFGNLPEKGFGSFSEIWNGSAWTVAPTSSSAGANAGLNAISCISATFCVAVGQSPGGPTAPYHVQSQKGRPLVEVWNGSSWRVQANPATAGSLFGVDCRSPSFCVAVGSGKQASQPLSEFWNGSHWSLQSTPRLRNTFNALQAVSCVAEDACFAVGFHNISPRGQVATVLLAERWDGHHWHAEYPPDHLPAEGVEMYGISCTSRSFCLAAASFAQGNGTVALSPFVERWNGVRWSSATAGLPKFSGLFGISCVTPDYCFSVGQFDPSLQPASGTTQLLTESWGGARWTRVATPRATEPELPEDIKWIETDPALLGVSCVALVGCTAVGAQGAGSINGAPLAQSEAGAPSAPPPEPEEAPASGLGRSADVNAVSGSVLVRRSGTHAFVPLSSSTQIPFGTVVDATHGSLSVTTAGPHGRTQTITLSEGEFVLTQGHNGVVVATLAGGDFSVCPTAAERAHIARAASKHAIGRHVVRKLWANGHGSFTTAGNYASASVRGTRWLTEDLCEGTLVHVVTDQVAVTNLVNHHHVTVKAGHSYLAKLP
jgi:hypothetical protein